jgi:hypothetical protein
LLFLLPVSSVTLDVSTNTVGDLLDAVKTAVKGSPSFLCMWGNVVASVESRLATWEEKKDLKLQEWEQAITPILYLMVRTRGSDTTEATQDYKEGPHKLLIKTLTGQFFFSSSLFLFFSFSSFFVILISILLFCRQAPRGSSVRGLDHRNAPQILHRSVPLSLAQLLFCLPSFCQTFVHCLL